MEEIGCHFKFERLEGDMYHNTKLLLSSGRNCLRYIIKERNIKTLYIPYFLCESISEVAKSENISIKYYHIDENLMPVEVDLVTLKENTYLYIVNYYGMLSDKILLLTKNHKNIIVDNTHDFYDKRDYGVDTIYNYRKYFGVPDGACIISGDLKYNPEYEKGKSLDKVIEMLSRDETGEFFHYPTFEEADKYYKNEGLRYMSNFTENYLRAINYQDILNKRQINYRTISAIVSKYNTIDAKSKGLTYMYPLYVEKDGEEIRKFLKENNVYSLRLWANVNWNGANSQEISTADNMVLLPIDQRYNANDMEHIGHTIQRYYEEKGKVLKR